MKKSTKCVEGSEEYQDVWAALEDDPGEAANLRARSALMSEIEVIIRKNAWTQAEAAVHCGVSQPRINQLLRGHISKFSLDALVKIVTSLGRKVRIEVEAA